MNSFHVVVVKFRPFIYELTLCKVFHAFCSYLLFAHFTFHDYISLNISSIEYVNNKLAIALKNVKVLTPRKNRNQWTFIWRNCRSLILSTLWNIKKHTWLVYSTYVKLLKSPPHQGQGYFQALFYYRYTVVNTSTQSSNEFWNSIFHNEFFHTTY